MVINAASTVNDNPASSDSSYRYNSAHAAFVAECDRLGIPSEVVNNAAAQGQNANDKWRRLIQQPPSGRKEELINATQSDADGNQSLARFTPALRLPSITPLRSKIASTAHSLLRSARAEALSAILASHGDTESPRFVAALWALNSVYLGMGRDPKSEQSLLEGTWRTLSRPNFCDCLGKNNNGDFIYTLGRMSFDMFRPTRLKCSIQRVVSTTQKVGPLDALPDSVPKSLKGEIDLLASEQDSSMPEEGHLLRTYNIEIEFSIEPRSKDENVQNEDDAGYRLPSKPIRATMFNRGYLLPDPSDPLRFTVWFTGGVMGPAKDKVDEAEAGRRKSAVKKSQHSFQTSMATIKDQTPSNTVRSSKMICPHLLHSCRRKNVCCALHGQQKLSRELRHKMKNSMSRYVRPRYGRGSRPTTTGLTVGDMAAPPFSSEWEDIFAPEDNWKRKTLGDNAKALAARLLLGADVPDHMEDDGSMSFALNHPMGGHGVTYVDVLYLDRDMRIIRGNAGSIFVQVKDGTGLSDFISQSQTRRISSSGQIRSRTRPKSHEGKAMAA